MTLNERSPYSGSSSLSNGVAMASMLLPDNYPTVIQKYTSCRWCLDYMLIVGFTLSMVLRNCMSFAIVCMTGEATRSSGDNFNGTCLSNLSTGNATGLDKKQTGEFAYSSEEQGLLISSTFYASVIAPLTGSFCSKRVGPKRCILLFMTISAILTLVTPICIRTHLYLAIACRVFVGIAVNTIVPASIDLWLHWAPKKEKAQLLSCTFIGNSLAPVVQYTLSGFVCLIPVDHGWPFIFYVFGGCTAVWCGLWYLTVYEVPENHPRISEHEKIFIMSNRTRTVKTKTIPWKSIAASKPVWAFFFVLFCHDWNNGIMFGYLPLYMATVLKFDVTQNGILSSLPYISRLVAIVCWNYISMKLSTILSVTHTRKIVMSTGYVVAASLAVCLCFLEEGQEYIAVAIFIISTPFQIVIISSVIISPVDIAPQFASVITSVGLIFSFTALMVSPLFVSFVITERTRQQWSIVFYTNAGIFIMAIGVFVLFGSGEIQSWAASVDQRSLEMSKENPAYVAEVDEITHM